MERELRSSLLMCASTFCEARSVSLATVGRLAAGDWRFFDRLDDSEKTFTARKYDEVIGWFSENWPDAVPWPSEVSRPSASEHAAEASA